MGLIQEALARRAEGGVLVSALGASVRWIVYSVVHAAPPRVAPRKIPARIFGKFARHEIQTRRAERTAAHQTRECHPSSRPQTETPDRLVAILRACRQMPAAPAEHRRECVAIDADQAAAELAREIGEKTARRIVGIASARDAHSAACLLFASICSIASTTASKVSMVEA